jgi:serine/threonine-protein kinase
MGFNDEKKQVMKSLIGQKLGQYEIKEKIGQGGMALVFKAYQPALDRFVALKVLSPTLAEVPGFTERFQREAWAVGRLSHPNILPIYDSGVEDNYNYIVMRYVPNSTTLSHLMKQHTPLNQMLEYIIQIVDALSYTHEQGIIHRDVKPSNILIDGRWALLSDFGLLKDQAEASRLTGSGNGIGTAAYMSPEQARGDEVDQRTDIYALGAILYEMLTGNVPHEASSPVTILVKRTTEPPIPLRDLNPDVPPPLENVVMHALNIDPERRYGSAALLATALRQAQPGVGSSLQNRDTFILSQHPVTEPVRNSITLRLPSKLTGRRLRFMVGGTVAVSIVLLLLLFWGLIASNGQVDQIEAQASTAGSSPTKAAIAVSPTETVAFIPFETPQAVINAEMEVRNGPGDNYDLLGYLPAGARAELISRDKADQWWQIKTSLGPTGAGWIKSAETVLASHTDSLPIALSPPTPTPPPTATSPPPTATPEPPTATLEPPTATSELPTWTPESFTTPEMIPTPSLTPTTFVNEPISPTATPIVGEFVLFKPASFEQPSYGVTEFEWQWTGPLPDNQGFEIRVWKDGETPAGVHDAVADNKNGRIHALGDGIYRLTTDITETPGVQARRGVYNWTVILVQIAPEYKELGIQASPDRFRFEPIQSGGGDNGDKDNGGGAFN